MNPFGKETIQQRFYFSYSKPEADYLKSKGFYYITKAIHPQTMVCFTMWDQSDELSLAIREYKLLHKNEKVKN